MPRAQQTFGSPDLGPKTALTPGRPGLGSWVADTILCLLKAPAVALFCHFPQTQPTCTEHSPGSVGPICVPGLPTR